MQPCDRLSPAVVRVYLGEYTSVHPRRVRDLCAFTLRAAQDPSSSLWLRNMLWQQDLPELGVWVLVKVHYGLRKSCGFIRMWVAASELLF